MEQTLRLETGYKNIHADLIEACRANSRKAQNKLYKLYYKAMYNTSLRIVNHPAEAEDIMQEAFLSAFEKIEQYSGEVSFGAWLKRIVVNQSIDALKKRKVYFEELNDSKQEVMDESEETDDERTGQSIENVKTCMEKMAHGYRLILSLYLFEGYDHEEISEIMHISSSTSRSQFTRAKRKLVELLKGKGQHETRNLKHETI